LVRKFIRSVASSEKKKWQLLQISATIYRLCVDGDVENAIPAKISHKEQLM